MGAYGDNAHKQKATDDAHETASACNVAEGDLPKVDTMYSIKKDLFYKRSKNGFGKNWKTFQKKSAIFDRVFPHNVHFRWRNWKQYLYSSSLQLGGSLCHFCAPPPPAIQRMPLGAVFLPSCDGEILECFRKAKLTFVATNRQSPFPQIWVSAELSKRLHLTTKMILVPFEKAKYEENRESQCMSL